VSFDRFSKGVKSIMSAESKTDAPAPSPAKSKQLLFILLQRGPNGLGLELDATNTVVNMVPGGAADLQGYFREGDTIASVDGIPLRGRLLQDVMDRSKNSYSFDVWRLTPVRRRARPKRAHPLAWHCTAPLCCTRLRLPRPQPQPSNGPLPHDPLPPPPPRPSSLPPPSLSLRLHPRLRRSPSPPSHPSHRLRRGRRRRGKR
jgi:hypothetical protein